MGVQPSIVSVTCGKCQTDLSVAIQDQSSVLQSFTSPNAPSSFAPSLTALQAGGLRLQEGLAKLETDTLAALESSRRAIANSTNASLKDLTSSIGQLHSEAHRQAHDFLGPHSKHLGSLHSHMAQHAERAVQAHQQQQVETPFSHYPLFPLELQSLFSQSPDNASRDLLSQAEYGRLLQPNRSTGLEVRRYIQTNFCGLP